MTESESEKWNGWKWITGKDSTASFDLKELVNRKDSYYHYLVAMIRLHHLKMIKLS